MLVALVAATIGMYPVVQQTSELTPYMMSFTCDGDFWTFLSYCAVTGGSITVIGSATGVTVMGLEKNRFYVLLAFFHSCVNRLSLWCEFVLFNDYIMKNNIRF